MRKSVLSDGQGKFVREVGGVVLGVLIASEGVPLHMDRDQARTVAGLYGLTSVYRDWANQ